MTSIWRAGNHARPTRRNATSQRQSGKSERAMHPRTLAIVCVLLLGGSFAARYLVGRFGLLPISEEVVLKQAVALGVTYYDGGELKTRYITDPVQVSDILATLRIQDKEDYNGGYYYSGHAGPTAGPAVEFRFPNGQVRNHRLYGGNSL